jgi:hypothetical protein
MLIMDTPTHPKGSAKGRGNLGRWPIPKPRLYLGKPRISQSDECWEIEDEFNAKLTPAGLFF